MLGHSNEATRIRDYVLQLTGARFDIGGDDLHPRFGNPVWFMRCREILQANKIPHVNAIWRENGTIRFESLMLGNTSQWIESDYGEEGMYRVVGKDLSRFDNPDFRNEFLKDYPSVKKRLERYERVVSRVSAKHEVALEIRYFGVTGLATFYLDAKFDATKEDPERELVSTEKAVSTLKDAYRQVTRF